MFNFEHLTECQNAILNIGFAVFFLVGLIWGLSGKKFKREAKFKPYLLWGGIILILGNVLFWTIAN